VYYRIWCSALVVLVVVVCEAGSEAVCAHSLRPSFTQPQPAQPVQNTICCNTRSSSPDGGHNDSQNMLDRSLMINI